MFERLDDLPPEASLDKETLRSIGLKSHVMMPIIVAGELHGGLSFGCVRAERSWPDDLLGRMRLLANVFGSALARKRAQEQLDHAIGFERLASGILASLVLAEPGQANSRSESACGRSASSWAPNGSPSGIASPAMRSFAPSSSWHADGFAPPARGWATRRICPGSCSDWRRATSCACLGSAIFRHEAEGDRDRVAGIRRALAARGADLRIGQGRGGLVDRQHRSSNTNGRTR